MKTVPGFAWLGSKKNNILVQLHLTCLAVFADFVTGINVINSCRRIDPVWSHLRRKSQVGMKERQESREDYGIIAVAL